MTLAPGDLGSNPRGSTMKFVYVVVRDGGAYSDRNVEPICAFLSKTEAEVWAKAQNDWCKSSGADVDRPRHSGDDVNGEDCEWQNFYEPEKRECHCGVGVHPPGDVSFEGSYAGTSYDVYEVPLDVSGPFAHVAEKLRQ